MYECPGCAGNLKFNIKKQKLHCEHCGKTVDPYSFFKVKDAEETVVDATVADAAGIDINSIEGAFDKDYEVTIFTCPQCGGQILSEDTTAATFCSYCDSATILDSRISRERRPKYIIPFRKTKEDCKEAYAKMMSRAIFAPKELKDEERIEKFRGIYMPYWVYSFEKNGPASFSGKKSRRRGDYLITKYYDLDCEVEAAYKGLAYDASATFYDHLSNAIAPFDMKKSKPFVPSFLSGFYADTSDVDDMVYQTEAEDMIIEDACKRVARHSAVRRYHADETAGGYTLRNAVRPTEVKAELAMLPVWFLSYRNGDRVSYAVVNGQSGKVAAELPIDFKKYLIGSAILAVPLFLLLNLFFTITPSRILWIAAILALICLIVTNVQLGRIFIRESWEDDKGLMSVLGKKYARANVSNQKNLAEEMAEGREKLEEKKKKTEDPSIKTLKKVGIIVLIVIAAMLLPYMLMSVMTVVMLSGLSLSGSVNLISIVSKLFIIVIIGISVFPVVWLIWKSVRKNRGARPMRWKERFPVIWKPLAGIVLALLILIIDPVADTFYYFGAFACMASVLWAIMDIIKQHNMLTTRKLPQLNKRGGDENA